MDKQGTLQIRLPLYVSKYIKDNIDDVWQNALTLVYKDDGVVQDCYLNWKKIVNDWCLSYDRLLSEQEIDKMFKAEID